MLLATTVMLLVFRLPSATLSVMWLISAKMFINEKPPFRLRKFHSIANLCATLNAATTFIMFIIYGAKFRSEFTRVYCCFWCKDDKTKKSSLLRENQERQIKQLISHETHLNEHNEAEAGVTPMIYSSEEQARREILRHSSSAATSTTTTTTASIGSLPSIRFFRYQRRSPRYSLDPEKELAHRSSTVHLPHQLTIREDEFHNDNNNEDDDYDDGPRSVTLTVSYFDLFQSWISCR